MLNLNDFHRIAAAKAEQFLASGLEEKELFPFLIREMNIMYELPINHEPTIDEEDLGEKASVRIGKFLKTLQKEIDEGIMIQKQLELYELLNAEEAEWDSKTINDKLLDAELPKLNDPEVIQVEELEAFRRTVIINLADWFADIIVYNRSEGMKFGLPLEAVLLLVMGSNFTKLGADGKPIKNAEGKFEKGPNFIAPEPAIETLLFGQEDLIDEALQVTEMADEIRNVTLPILMNSAVPDSADDDLDEIY